MQVGEIQLLDDYVLVDVFTAVLLPEQVVEELKPLS